MNGFDSDRCPVCLAVYPNLQYYSYCQNIYLIVFHYPAWFKLNPSSWSGNPNTLSTNYLSYYCLFSNIDLFHTGNSVRGALTTEEVRETLCTNTQSVDCVWCPYS